MHLFVGHVLEISHGAIDHSLPFSRSLRVGFCLDNHALFAMFIERLQIGHLADDFAGSPEHVVFQFVFFIEAEAHTRLGFRDTDPRQRA